MMATLAFVAVAAAVAAAASATRIYVVSLDGVPGASRENLGRMEKMRAAWEARCPTQPTEFVLCPGPMISTSM